jgi:endonuclease YncB( thermonuclease family)
MGMRDVFGRLKAQRAMIVRGTGLVLAAGAVCAALIAGSVLRDPARASAAAASASMTDGKDQTRVKVAGAPAENVAMALAPAPVLHPSEDWREQDFTFVGVVDGRTLSAGGITIRLAGLELPPPEQVCRTLDDRLEQCTARAATQLELLTRSRPLACRYRMVTSSEASGSCRVGSRDLAERMIRTGYARPADDRRGAVVADADRTEASIH